jgi:hypothetical protein
MIINNLDILQTLRCPAKANPELVIDPDAPLALPVPAQFFKPVSWRHPKIVHAPRQIKLNQLAQSLPFNLRPPPDMAESEQLFSILGSEGYNHEVRY